MDDIQQKLSQTQTMKMIQWFLQMHRPKPKPLLHGLKPAAGGISLHVNANKTEYVCFIWEGNIFTPNGGSLKLENKFRYLYSSVSSTESDVNIRLVNEWIAINWLSIIWKSDLFDLNGMSSKQQLCQYYYADAPHERWQNVLRKSWTGTQ